MQKIQANPLTLVLRCFMGKLKPGWFVAFWLWVSPGLTLAQQAPDAFIQQLAVEVLDVIRKDPALKAGDLQKIGALLDTKFKPYINFQRMTASAVGPAWRQATPEQQKQLQDEFRLLLMRSYSGALAQIKDNSQIVVKPVRANSNDIEVVWLSDGVDLGGGKDFAASLGRLIGNRPATVIDSGLAPRHVPLHFGNSWPMQSTVPRLAVLHQPTGSRVFGSTWLPETMKHVLVTPGAGHEQPSSTRPSSRSSRRRRSSSLSPTGMHSSRSPHWEQATRRSWIEAPARVLMGPL